MTVKREVRQRGKGNQLGRDGSWSVMVSHSGTDKKRERARERQSVNRSQRDKHTGSLKEKMSHKKAKHGVGVEASLKKMQ